MSTGDIYSIGHLVPSHLRLVYVVLVGGGFLNRLNTQICDLITGLELARGLDIFKQILVKKRMRFD